MEIGALNGLDAAARRALGVVRDAVGAARTTTSDAARDLVRSRPDDPLDERDTEFIRATLPSYRRLTQLYFRPKVRGLEHIPAEGPVLLVGNHSGGTLIADTFAFAYAFYSYFGPERPFYQLAHDLAVRFPGVSVLLRRYGTISASHENAGKALDAGAVVLVYPGGDYESYRPTSHSGEIEFGGRSGFIRLALSHEVPIVPVVAIGGQETALFVTRGQRMARLLQLDRMRLKVLPVQVAPPWGVTVLDLPGRLPLPSEITIQVLPKVELRERFGPHPDEQEAYDGITEDMQHVLDELSAERDLPVVGKVGSRSSESVPSAREDGAHHEPWRGYDRMPVGEVARRLRGMTDERVLSVRLYEERHKRRKGVLSAVERELER